MKVESRLGKGLSTFFENKQVEVPVFKNQTENTEQGDIKYLPIGNIIPNEDQPRKNFKPLALYPPPPGVNVARFNMGTPSPVDILGVE